jgi:hypothetical protein
MRVYQARYEPDAPGRAEALLSLAALCATPSPSADCSGLPGLLRERAAEDPARIVRQLAERTLQDLAGPKKEIAPIR